MAFGDCADDAALRAAWKKFCHALEDAGEIAFKDSIPPSPGHRVDAFRLLTQNLGQAFDLALETKNTKYPVIHAFCTPFCKLGGDNADFTYQQAWVDGESVYKISGNRGTSRFFNIAVHGPRAQDKDGYRALHDPFGDIPQANMFGHEMEIRWDGSFEVQIGGERPDPRLCPNWLPTNPGTRKLFIRNGFDRWSETPAQIRIERVGMESPRPMPTPVEMVTAMEWAGNFMTGLKTDWPDWTYEFSEDSDPEDLNNFPTARRPLNNIVNNVATDRRRGRSVYVMFWKLQPDEALIIEWDANDIFWMMTNMNSNIHSMDYLYRPVSYSPARTKVDSDGKVRIVMAHKDPGFHNWLDTQGLDQGSVANRNMLTDHITVFNTRVVKHADLDQVMPADSARVTAEERAEMLRERFHSITRRYVL
jgi:hypothetical protein